MFHLFDLHINAALTFLSGYRSRPGCENFWDVQHLVLIPYLRALPTSLGGLGLPLHGGLAGTYGCLRSRLITHTFLDRHCSNFGSLLAEKDKWSRTTLLESKDIRHWNFFKKPAASQENSWFALQILHNSVHAITINFPASFRAICSRDSPTSYRQVAGNGTSNPFFSLPDAHGLRERMEDTSVTTAPSDNFQAVRDPKVAARLIASQHIQDRNWLVSTLRDTLGWRDCAAWLLHSEFDKSGAIFTKINPSGFFESRKFSHLDFQDCLSLRLMLPPVPLQQDPRSDEYVCQCAQRISLLKDRFHCLGCTNLQKHFNRRHYAVVKVLQKAMWQERLPFVYPLTSQDGTTAEHQLPFRDDAPNRRADLGFVGRQHIRFIVDVAVMAPTAKSYIDHHGSHLRINAAHGHIEQQKESRYLQHTHPTTPSNYTYSLIPFIIDCTGNIGLKAKSFFQEQNMSDKRKKSAIRQIYAVIDWYNAAIRRDYVELMVPPIAHTSGRRMTPNIDPHGPKRGRPRGSANSRRTRSTRGERQQAAAVANTNNLIDTDNNFSPMVHHSAVSEVAPDTEGTRIASDESEGEELSTRQT